MNSHPYYFPPFYPRDAMISWLSLSKEALRQVEERGQQPPGMGPAKCRPWSPRQKRRRWTPEGRRGEGADRPADGDNLLIPRRLPRRQDQRRLVSHRRNPRPEKDLSYEEERGSAPVGRGTPEPEIRRPKGGPRAHQGGPMSNERELRLAGSTLSNRRWGSPVRPNTRRTSEKIGQKQISSPPPRGV